MKYTQSKVTLFEKGKDNLDAEMRFLWDKRRNGLLEVLYIPLQKKVKKK